MTDYRDYREMSIQFGFTNLTEHSTRTPRTGQTMVNTRIKKEFFNPETKAFVDRFTPILIYFYEHQHYPYAVLNPLAKALLQDDPRFSEGRYLFERIDDPDRADFLVLPCDLNYFEYRESQVFDQLPYYQGKEERHIFFDRRDQGELLSPLTSIYLRVSLTRNQISESVICISYLEPVDNFFKYYLCSRKILYDVSFIGERTEFREQLVCALEKEMESTYFRLRNRFYLDGYMAYQPMAQPNAVPSLADREEFIEVAHSSRFVLAPQGYGTSSLRFFEALSLGIPPILVSGNCALPYEHLIDYESICLSFEARDPEVALQIKEAVLSMDVARYEEMCRMARYCFDTYLSPRNFLFLLYQALDRLVCLRRPRTELSIVPTGRDQP